jgi:hypothetical protein
VTQPRIVGPPTTMTAAPSRARPEAPGRPWAEVTASREWAGASGLARLGAAVMVVGGPTILGCVTVLKYLHEFVEASRAVAR